MSDKNSAMDKILNKAKSGTSNKSYKKADETASKKKSVAGRKKVDEVEKKKACYV